MAGYTIYPNDGDKLNCPGIYMITCVATGMVYIGQSVNVETRIYKHQSYLRNGSHSNSRLQREFDKYGADEFIFERIMSVFDRSSEILTPYEQACIDEWPEAQRLNLSPIAGSAAGFKFSEESRERHAEGIRARANNPKWRESNAAANRAKAADPEWRARNAAKVRATHSDPEYRRKRNEMVKRFDDPSKVAKGTRNGVCVTVGGVSSEHQSVKYAFTAHELPIGVHVNFRGKLKKSRREVFVHNGKEYTFELID